MNLSIMPFKQAKNYKRGRLRPVQLIVLHSMEASEKGNTAENVAAYFAGANAPMASAHYCIDSDSIVQCVRLEDTAYHCKNANANGIGIEHAGYAKQSSSEWLDEYGQAMLELSAKLVADLCHQFNIPVRRAKFANKNNPQVIESGICGHMDVPLHGVHYDPGVGFPWDFYLERVQEHYDGVKPSEKVAEKPTIQLGADSIADSQPSLDVQPAQTNEPAQQSNEGSGQQVVIQPNALTAGDAAKPIVSNPGDPAVQATTGGFKSMVTSAVGWATGAGAGLIALLKDNKTLLIIAAVILVIAGILYFVRQLILDLERLRIASDPTKFNSK